MVHDRRHRGLGEVGVNYRICLHDQTVREAWQRERERVQKNYWGFRIR